MQMLVPQQPTTIRPAELRRLKRPFTADEVLTILTLWDAGTSIDLIAKKLHRASQHVYWFVDALQNEGTLAPRKERGRQIKPIKYDSAKALVGKEFPPGPRHPAEASIIHLIDLKRAGHSPTRTEYRVEPEGVFQRQFEPIAFEQSYIGSTAAMCSEN